jgi:hypothetical protein
MSRLYCGVRLRDGFGRVAAHRVWVETQIGLSAATPRQYSRELVAGRSDWSWGRKDAGALVLACYILLDATGDWERSAPWFHAFAQDYVARWPERWTVREECVLSWLLEREKQAAADEVTQRLFVASGISEGDHGEE